MFSYTMHNKALRKQVKEFVQNGSNELAIMTMRTSPEAELGKLLWMRRGVWTPHLQSPLPWVGRGPSRNPWVRGNRTEPPRAPVGGGREEEPPRASGPFKKMGMSRNPVWAGTDSPKRQSPC